MAQRILPPNRYAAYVRVSTSSQEENGFGPDIQTADITAYAEYHHLHIAEWFFDDITGDTEAKDRPGLGDYERRQRAGEFTGIIAAKPDRLARMAWIGMKTVEELHARGVEVHFANNGKVENTPEARFQIGIFFGVGHLDKQQLLKKFRDAKFAKVTVRKRPMNLGIAPLGYQFIGRKRESDIVPNDDERPTVELIYRLYLDDGYALTAIAEELTRRRLPTVEDIRPRRYKDVHKQRAYGEWSKAGVYAVLKNPIYGGRIPYYRALYNQVLLEDGSYRPATLDDDPSAIKTRVEKPLDDPSIVWLDVEPIIDPERWHSVQERLTSRHGKGRRSPVGGAYLLAHRIKCSCGYSRCAMTPSKGKHQKKEYPRLTYYRCAGFVKGHTVNRCTVGTVNAYDLDATVWQYCDEVLLNRDNLSAALKKLHADHDQKVADAAADRADLAARLEHLDTRRSNRLAIVEDGILSSAEYKARQAEDDILATQYRASLASVDDAARAVEQRRRQFATLEAYRADIRESVDTSTFAGRRMAVEMLGVTVVAGKENGQAVVYVRAEMYPDRETERLTIEPAKTVDEKSGGLRLSQLFANGDPVVLTARLVVVAQTTRRSRAAA